jgi:group I intron endonuclease
MSRKRHLDRPTKLYCISCSATSKMYVGMTCRSLELRFKEHVLMAKKDAPMHLSRAIRKYGSACFSIDLLHEYDTMDEAAHAEEEIIHHLSLASEGYNMSPGGYVSPTLGVGHTEKTRKMISEKAKARYLENPDKLEFLREMGRRVARDPAIRARQAEKKRGVKITEEHRNKIRQSHLGKKNTTETKKIMSRSAFLRWERHRIADAHFPTDAVGVFSVELETLYG